jgi:hypothetical protein
MHSHEVETKSHAAVILSPLFIAALMLVLLLFRTKVQKKINNITLVDIDSHQHRHKNQKHDDRSTF